MQTSLENKVAVVTGGGRGIGRAIATQLTSAGVEVILIARSQSELDEVVREISAAGGSARALAADISTADGVALVARNLVAHGPVDILINNAATVGPLTATVELEFSSFAATFDLNVVAPAILSARLASSMVRRGWGRIVNVSSAVVSHPSSMETGNAYTASKAALEAHTLNFGLELTGTGVTVNAFRPGMVDTSMQEWIRAQDPQIIGSAFHERFTRAYNAGKLLSPEHSAAALIAHLASDDNGEIWSV